jgi:tail collar domain
MMPFPRAAIVAMFICAMTAKLFGAQFAVGQTPVGEVRLIAVGRTSHDVTVAELHRQGWLEAHGQLLRATQFPQLYKIIGRTWTASGVTSEWFAVPKLRDFRQASVSSDNPYGVLGPGDLVSSGLPRRITDRSSPISYWIFVGRDVSRAEFGSPR